MKYGLALVLLSLFAGPAMADVALPAEQGLPKKLDGIGIDDRHGIDAPKGLHFKDQDGNDVTLDSYFDGEHPVLLVMAYYQCQMLCSIVMNGVTEGAKGVAWDIGKQYKILSVSFDRRDTVELATAKRKNYIEAYGRPIGPKGWDFLISSDGGASSKALADAIGFHYSWDEKTDQFAHAAGIFLFTPKGKLSRVMYGINYKPTDLRLALVEASEGKLGSAWDKVLLFCFHYDPNANGYTVAVINVMKLGGLITMLLLGFFLFRLWRRENDKPTPPTISSSPSSPPVEHART